MALHAISDSLIALSYYSIPLLILYFVRKRNDVPFPALFLMFGAFIVACGTTHILDVLTLWYPAYWLSGWVKAATAAISLASAIALVRIVPLALSLPSHEDLRRLNAELEERVRLRTADITAANERLHTEAHQRRQAEDEVRRLNEVLQRRVDELQTLLDLLPVGIGIGEDPACQVIRSNRALDVMLGTPPRSNISLSAPAGRSQTPFEILQNGRKLRPEELPMQRAAANNIPMLNFEEVVARADGRRIDLLVNAVPLHNETGAVRGCLATFMDVTERNKADRDRLLFERRLQETQKLESLGVLSGGIAHDFNNLLTGILGNASLARIELAPEKKHLVASINRIEQAALRAAELCKQLLAYAGKGRFIIQPLDLNRLIEETARMLAISASKKVTLELKLSPGLPAFSGDATQIRQVLMNLVINASEAIGDRAGVVTVRTSCVKVANAQVQTPSGDLEAGDYLVLTVTDDGEGMSAETQARIFDPFFTTKFAGRGLGLAAVQGIVRGHKGSIQVKSEPAVGTTFIILLPVTTEAAVTTETPSAPAEIWRGQGRILVVDDEPAVRSVIEPMLTQLGFSPVLAEDGESALAIVRADLEGFRAVLLDLTMPRMDGEEALRSLQAIIPNLPVILMSGFNEQAAISRFVGRGLAGFLPKPFTAEMLAARLRKALEKTDPAQVGTRPLQPQQ
ncbi:MAG: response regulator [Verrucomicrobia bacterium]|nr:response regulator [Verrucomicrobiota bacterium]